MATWSTSSRHRMRFRGSSTRSTRSRRSNDHRPSPPPLKERTPMRVVIAGAGSVGRSIARELLHNGHQVLLIDKDADDVQASRVPEASWLLADACEISSLHEAGLADCDV